MEFFVEDDISAEEALQLIKTEPPKGSNELKNGGEDYQVYENDNQSLNDPFASYFYSQQVSNLLECTWFVKNLYIFFCSSYGTRCPRLFLIAMPCFDWNPPKLSFVDGRLPCPAGIIVIFCPMWPSSTVNTAIRYFMPTITSCTTYKRTNVLSAARVVLALLSDLVIINWDLYTRSILATFSINIVPDSVLIHRTNCYAGNNTMTLIVKKLVVLETASEYTVKKKGTQKKP